MDITVAISNQIVCTKYYVDEDYLAGPERSNWHGSESSTLETDVYIWCYTLLVVHAQKKIQ